MLADAFPSDDGYDLAAISTTVAGEGPPRTHTQRVPEIVVKAVCADCNSGWMSTLEGKTKEFLEPMVRGEDVRLDVARQFTLAHWAAKVAILLDCVEAGATILAPTDVVQVFREGCAPSGFHIRLGFRAEPEPEPFNFYLANHYAAPVGTNSGEGRDLPPNSFSSTLASAGWP